MYTVLYKYQVYKQTTRASRYNVGMESIEGKKSL